MCGTIKTLVGSTLDSPLRWPFSRRRRLGADLTPILRSLFARQPGPKGAYLTETYQLRYKRPLGQQRLSERFVRLEE